MNSSHALPHSQYLELLDRHGRAALDAFSRLAPDSKVPPHATGALDSAREHLSTLEIWAWLLEHPESDWRAHEAAAPPGRQEDVLAAIGAQRDRLTRLLVDLGPEQELDYFGRPGTSYDVARLLAHEAISVAAAASAAGGVPSPPLHPDVASDCVDRALAHWSEPDAVVDWSPVPAHLVAADTGRSWWIRFGEDRVGGGAIAPGAAGHPAIGLTDESQALLLWLEGHDGPSPKVDGDVATLRSLRVALGHRVDPVRQRPWWRRRQERD